ncbi:MAG: hypothetical protein RR376_18890 [Janthinobacterium sp.]
MADVFQAASGQKQPFEAFARCRIKPHIFPYELMDLYQKGTNFTGCLNIRPTLSFEATVAVLGEALGIRFCRDQGGKYEEYPAYLASALGLELALLAPPLPEFDTRDVPDDCFQLIIGSLAHVKGVGVNVDLSALIKAQLLACTELVIEQIDS